MPPQAKIIVNGKFARQRLTGVQRYAQEVISHLGDKVRLEIPPDNDVLARGPLWEQFVLPGLVHDGSLLWSPTNTGPLLVSRQVVTIHDISPIDHPEWFTATFSIWYGFLMPRLSRRVKRIITDSDFSKERIVTRFNIPDEKVLVIHLGVGRKFKPLPQSDINRIREKYGLAQDYLLVVGSLEPRKNLPRFFQAWRQADTVFKNINLVVVGVKGYPFKDLSLGELPASVHLLGAVPDLDLPGLYAGAIALAYPSVYEGFGLPVLEAMACGTPVLSSTAASLPEAVGEAGLLFDPYAIDEMALAIERILADGELRHELIHKGLERARQFSWEVTAQKTWEVLRQAYEEIG
jgi:glycosyltransferase involved in cell wall biosynthesis